MNILLIKLSAIGDVVHTLPFLEALRRKFPEVHITWVIEEVASGIILNHPLLDRIIISKRKKWLKNFSGLRRIVPTFLEIRSFMKDLRSKNYDLVVDLQGLFKSGLLVFLCSGLYCELI